MSDAGVVTVTTVLGPLVDELEQVFGDLDSLADQFRAVCRSGRPGRDDLAPLRPAIFEILQGHRGLVAGAGIITAPDLPGQAVDLLGQGAFGGQARRHA